MAKRLLCNKCEKEIEYDDDYQIRLYRTGVEMQDFYVCYDCFSDVSKQLHVDENNDEIWAMEARADRIRQKGDNNGNV